MTRDRARPLSAAAVCSRSPGKLAARLSLVSSLALPPLSNVAAAWVDLIRDGELIDNGGASLYRGGVGLAARRSWSAAASASRWRWWRPLDVFVNPLVELFYPMPKSALIPVTVLWLGFGDGSKILLIFLGCMLPVTLGAYQRRARQRSGAGLVGAQHGREPRCACCGTW